MDDRLSSVVVSCGLWRLVLGGGWAEWGGGQAMVGGGGGWRVGRAGREASTNRQVEEGGRGTVAGRSGGGGIAESNF